MSICKVNECPYSCKMDKQAESSQFHSLSLLSAEWPLFPKVKKEEKKAHMQKRSAKESIPHVNMIVCRMIEKDVVIGDWNLWWGACNNDLLCLTHLLVGLPPPHPPSKTSTHTMFYCVVNCWQRHLTQVTIREAQFTYSIIDVLMMMHFMKTLCATTTPLLYMSMSICS